MSRFTAPSDNAGDPTSIGIHNAANGSQPMLHNGSILRTASALAITALIAQPLAGCSGATQALSGFTPAVRAQQTAAVPMIQKGPCANPVYGDWEYYNPGPPAVYREYHGWYETYPSGTIPCGDDVIAKPNPIGALAYIWGGTDVAIKTLQGNPCRACLAEANNGASTIAVVRAALNSAKTLSTLTTCKACTITGLAVGADESIYAAVLPASPSANSAVYIYAPGATSPTTVLQGPSGLTGVGTAVDAEKNVYWTANAPSQSGEVWKFPYESSGTYGSPALLTTTSEVGGVLIAATGKGKHALEKLVFSEPSAGNIAITDLSASGSTTLINVGGMPEALTLNTSEKMLYAVDPKNDIISTYAFPEGTLVSSVRLEVKGQKIVIPTAVQP
ncbi:MAG TPA: hypothetical protein VIX83_05255, partial [Candidatus Cybelea sp.]